MTTFQSAANAAKDFITSRFGNDLHPACIVAKADPFTLGHLYLASVASRREKAVVFFVSPGVDCLFPLNERLEMARIGLSALDNVLVLDGSGLFLPEIKITGGCGKGNSSEVMSAATEAAGLYQTLSSLLGLGVRYQGDEPKDEGSEIYLNMLRQSCRENSTVLKVAERKRVEQTFICSDLARSAFLAKDRAGLARFCPVEIVRFLGV